MGQSAARMHQMFKSHHEQQGEYIFNEKKGKKKFKIKKKIVKT
jgi:hypothetical protein